MTSTIYLNGQFMEEEQASISPFDRGYVFADGVYEVVKYYKGKPFRLNNHLKRLQRSLNELDMENAFPDSLEEVFEELLHQNNLIQEQAGIYVQISRGTYRRVHYFPENLSPTIFAYAFDLTNDRKKLDEGIEAITHEDIRWKRCDIKSVSLLPNTMLYNKAHKKGAGECIMHRDNEITEASHSSVFAVKEGTLLTRPLSNLILPGITREVILEICTKNQLPFEERSFSLEELYNMDEVFIAGTGSEITPVVKIDGRPIGNGQRGVMSRKLQELFFQLT